VSANAAELIPKSVKNSFLSIVCTVVAPFYFFGICYTKYQAKQGTQNSRDKKIIDIVCVIYCEQYRQEEKTATIGYRSSTNAV
jgi:hypothetical protein